MKKSDIAFARSEMFREAADHLDGNVANDAEDKAAIPYVQKIIRGYQEKWLRKYQLLREAGL